MLMYFDYIFYQHQILTHNLHHPSLLLHAVILFNILLSLMAIRVEKKNIKLFV